MDFLAIEPQKELEFVRPFNNIVKSVMIVKNTSLDTPVAFKVKTTAPKQYCVRPNSGRIPPGESCEVQVLLQAMKQDPPLDFKCKDKFLIQGIKINNDLMQMGNDAATIQILDLWTQAEKLKNTSEDMICEIKLRCSYVAADTSVRSLEQKSVISNPETISNHESIVPEASVEASKPIDPVKAKETNSGDIIKSLSAAVEQYKAEIERLKTQGLRQRKVESTKEASKIEKTGKLNVVPGSILGQTTVVPIEWVLLFIIISFLIGSWMF